jgi:Effector Associated Constant Component 1
MASEPSQPLKVTIMPQSERFSPDDDRWLDHVAGLARELRVGTGALEVQRTSQPGAKGAVEALVLALGTAGVFTSAVEVIKAWLGRDRSRTVEVSWQDGDDIGRFVISGDKIDNAALGAMAEVLTARLQGPP